jgi:hypothetical protein
MKAKAWLERSLEGTQVWSHLSRPARLGVYLLVLILPGSFLTVPFLAWWLHYRNGENL